jgi:amidase
VEPAFAAIAAIAGDGVLTRTVLDTALALDAIAGDEHPGPLSVPAPAVPFATSALMPPERLRIRVCAVPPGGVAVDPECVEAVQAAAGLLADLGHEVTEGAPDWDDDELQGHWDVAGLAALHGVLKGLEREMGAPLDPELLEPPGRALVGAPPVTPEALAAASEGLQRFTRRVIGSWPPGSLLLTPTTARMPAPVGGMPPSEGIRCSAFVRSFNITGQHAISLPLHRTAAGLPVGVQLAAPVGREARLLSLAGQLEAAAPWPLTAPRPAG